MNNVLFCVYSLALRVTRKDDSADHLRFNSQFESGNLRKAIQVSVHSLSFYGQWMVSSIGDWGWGNVKLGHILITCFSEETCNHHAENQEAAFKNVTLKVHVIFPKIKKVTFPPLREAL